jgi:hypothetical protein
LEKITKQYKLRHMKSSHSSTSALRQWRPAFIREIRAHAERDGMMRATHDILRRDNVSVNVSGSLDAIANHQGGMLFIGNHNRQFEFVALMAVLSGIGRTSMKNIVKFYVENQINWAFGKPGTDITLPVYPRLLDKDRKSIMNLELGSRMLFYRSLKPGDEARRATAESTVAAAKELAEGGVVNIFPCGSITNNMVKPWREGTGRIVSMVPEAQHGDTLVIPYHADNINRLRLVAAVAARGKGLLGRPQHIDMAIGEPQTITEVMQSIDGDLPHTPMAITDTLRQHYVEQFS